MGSYFCSCPHGYRLSANRSICEGRRTPSWGVQFSSFHNTLNEFATKRFIIFRLDIDECREVAEICTKGKCTNTEGGVTCSCPPGFIPSSVGIDCVDIRQDFCYSDKIKGTNAGLRS